jgi:hypothetical protein
MEQSSTAREFLWDEQFRPDRADQATARRQWRNAFALAVTLIVVTLAVATWLARMAARGTASQGPDRATSLDRGGSLARPLFV